MRFNRRFTAIAAIGLTAALVLAGCTKKNEESSGTTAPAGGGATSAASGSAAGGKEAEAALGNVQWLYQGPTQADAAAQADIVRTYLQQKVDALFIAPNDPDSMAPLIKQGIDEIKKYSASKYPDAQIVDTVYAGEDVAKATQMGTDLMNAHPDMTGMVGVCSTAGPGIAQAVANANKIGKVYTVGMGTPNDMKKYLESGAASAGVLWDAKALGYLTAWAGVQMAEGKPFQATQKVADGALENVTWDESTKTLLMGDPLTFTKETVGNYNF